MNYIHAFDPGETTGFALLSYVDGHHLAPTLLRTHEIVGPRRLHDWVNLVFRKYPGDVVIEDFRLFAGSAQHLIHNKFPAVITIGGLVYICSIHNIEPTYQMASCKLSFPNHQLEKMGVSLPSSGHCIDAIRHGMYYYFNNISTLVRR